MSICHVILCYITYVNMSCHVLLHNMSHVMLRYIRYAICHVMLCYITCGMSCYITNVML